VSTGHLTTILLIPEWQVRTLPGAPTCEPYSQVRRLRAGDCWNSIGKPAGHRVAVWVSPRNRTQICPSRPSRRLGRGHSSAHRSQHRFGHPSAANPADLSDQRSATPCTTASQVHSFGTTWVTAPRTRVPARPAFNTIFDKLHSGHPNYRQERPRRGSQPGGPRLTTPNTTPRLLELRTPPAT
jgi:hypothetical protein